MHVLDSKLLNVLQSNYVEEFQSLGDLVTFVVLFYLIQTDQ